MDTAYPDLEQHDTFPKVLAYNAKNWPDEIALREKDFGIWNAFTWAQYNDRVKRFACGLAKLGIGKGDVVGLIGDNRPDWVAGEIAAHAAGATSIGLYRDVLDQEVMYLVTYSEAKVILAEDEEQVDKFLALEDRIPSVQHIIYSDPRGMRKYDDPRLMTADTLSEMGDAVLAEDPQAGRPRRRSGDPLHDLRHHGPSQACRAWGRAGVTPLPVLSRCRSQGAG
jgi:long-chain acyl-CoA synthetase